ncbi:MAG TPA: hypothetical protein VF786_15355, partial [Terriglobales bacterium]
RLLLRLQQAQGEFTTAAGIPPNLPFLQEIAGDRSALAVYDIGKLELLYISHLESSRAIQSALWQKRSQFEPRESAGKQFFVRTDSQSGRVVAFAVDGDMLILGTREDLVAGALSLLAGNKMAPGTEEAWYANAVKASTAPGELRMVLHLSEIAKTPQFRTYWIQRNVTEMRQYESAVSDLRLSSATYREERVLLPKAALDCSASTNDAVAVSNLIGFAPDSIGFYRANSAPSVEDALAALETKVLTPRLGPTPPSKLAPSAALTSGTVTKVGLDARIDVPPSNDLAAGASDDALRKLLTAANPRAILELHRSASTPDGVFVRLYSTLVLTSNTDWNADAVKSAIRNVVNPAVTTGGLGTEWKTVQTGTQQYFELDGLYPVAIAVRGKYVFVSNDPETLAATLSRVSSSGNSEPLLYAARFDHARERHSFAQLTSVVDKPSRTNAPGEPQFFSQNINSLSEMFSRVQSESLTSKCKAGNVQQTVVYEWAQ